MFGMLNWCNVNINAKIKELKKYFDNPLVLVISGVILVILIQVIIEYLMGRLFICKCDSVLLWYNNANGPGNSQHLLDWYSLTHIIHGFVFYGLLWLVFRRLPLRTRFFLAVLIECIWEIFENSPFIIDRYRTVTFAFDYYGDSIINSIFDVFVMMLGYVLARKFPVWLSIIIILFLEIFLVVMIRDSLILNFVTLVHPIEVIKNWQAAAPVLPDLNITIFRR